MKLSWVKMNRHRVPEIIGNAALLTGAFALVITP